MNESDLAQCFLAVAYLRENANRDVHLALPGHHPCSGNGEHMYDIEDLVDYKVGQ